MKLASEINKFLENAKKDGLSKDEVMDVLGLTATRESTDKSKGRSTLNVLSYIVVIIAVLWGFIFGFKSPTKLRDELVEGYNASFCLVDHSQTSLEFVRPVADCQKMCAGMKEVPRLESISREEFIKDYAYSGRPLVVTGATKNWTAMNVFSFKYFKNLYGKYDDAYDVQDSSCQFFPYKTNFGSLEEVFLMSKRRAAFKGKSWYIGWSNCHTKVMAEVRKHYSKPEFLPTDAETSQQDWFFMGGAGPGAPVHIDTVDRPSWQAQISGTKSWSLIPPAECESVCYPVNLTMNTGDIVVVDTNQWFHSTHVHPGKVSITVGAEYD